MTQTLEEIPGVGPQLAGRIRSHFNGDDQFFAAVKRQDVEAIAAVNGLSVRRAVDLVHAASGQNAGHSFIATAAAQRLHDSLIRRLLTYASTEAGRNRIQLLRPLPSAAAALAHQEQVMAAKATAQNIDARQIRRHLRRLQKPSEAKPVMQAGLLVAATPGDEELLRNLGVARWATIGAPDDLQQADGYDVVIAYGDLAELADGDNVLAIGDGAQLHQLVPASVIHPANARRTTIEACVALAELTGRPTVAADMLRCLDESKPAPRHMDIAGIVETIRSQMVASVQEKSGQIQLGGPELLQAMATGKLPLPMQQIVDDTMKEGRQKLRAELGFDAQPFIAGLPITVDEREVARLAAGRENAAAVAEFQAQQRTAAKLSRLATELDDEIRSWFEFDAEFALGWFAADHDLQPATFGRNLSCDESIHLDLARSSRAQRIHYELGATHRVAMLTGANSGGKSTLLEQICQLAMMAHMGLPVAGQNVVIPWLDELHLVTASRGMDAGAFETFLRDFLPVTRGDAKRLVLVDEVEAVTELEAAGRIIGFVIDRLAQTSSFAVVVSHLAPQIMAHVTDSLVRVDGISATGLDDNNQLIVDRQPRMGEWAKSTPELIIQRLAAMTKGAEQTLYQELLERFPDTRYA